MYTKDDKLFKNDILVSHLFTDHWITNPNILLTTVGVFQQHEGTTVYDTKNNVSSYHHQNETADVIKISIFVLLGIVAVLCLSILYVNIRQRMYSQRSI